LVLVVAIMVVASLETRKTPCGKYTTYPGDHDRKMCPELYEDFCLKND